MDASDVRAALLRLQCRNIRGRGRQRGNRVADFFALCDQQHGVFASMTDDPRGASTPPPFAVELGTRRSW